MTVTERSIQQVPADQVNSGIVDCDVHPYTPSGMASVLPYMPASWRRRFELKGAEVPLYPVSLRYQHPSVDTNRPETRPRPGAFHASDPAFVKSQLIDTYGIAAAIMSSLEAGWMSAGMAGPDEANVLCSAYNDFFIDNWLGYDCFKYVIAVPPQDPQAAAQEVVRVGEAEGVVGVFLPQINALLGSRYYYPIYEAAHDLQLPIFTHVTGCEGVYQGAPVPAGGWPESFAERRAGFSVFAEANLISIIFSGVLERFPRLNFLFAEYGFAWALPLCWRMDSTWRHTRIETPWVKKFPSDYVSERIRFTTQPVDEPRSPEHLDRLVEMLGPELLLFSTDYPHWDGDEPHAVFRRLGPSEKNMVFRQNARTFFRLP